MSSSSSTILYKFRSGTTFEALPLPGSAARLLDVKKAIVKAKRLDATSQALEFDLSVRDATTNQEYGDEAMLLPRGTRLIVQRLPAARGHGFLARMARAEAGARNNNALVTPATVPSNFYTIQSREEDDEFVPTATAAGQQQQDDKELAALMAVTDPGMATTTATSGGLRPAVGYNRPAGSGPPPPRGGAGGTPGHYGPPKTRPNADPELRDQEAMPKKRATGIPRTFLNLSAPPVTTGDAPDEPVARLQPNAIGFEELKTRGGGQSENLTGTKRDLDYALKLTATAIPEHLQCGICHNVVKNAMLLPWDVEGRTACETCIRDALTQNGFRDPLTGIEGVSPDDLLPNYGLRKAADAFVKGVMEKMDEIDQQQGDEEEDTAAVATASGLVEGDMGDSGVLVSRKNMGRSRMEDDDPFGGGDADFGGDVFDVQAAEPEEEAEGSSDEKPGGNDGPEKSSESAAEKDMDRPTRVSEDDKKESVTGHTKETQATVEQSNNANKSSLSQTHGPEEEKRPSKDTKPDSDRTSPQSSASDRREARRRGPPAGYAIGPAGGSAVRGAQPSPYGGRGRGGVPPAGRGYPPERAPFRGGRGPAGGRFFNGGGRHEFEGGSREPHHGHYDGRHPRQGEHLEEDRARKRGRSDSFEDPRGGRYDARARGGFRGRGDFYRGRGGRGPPFRGGGRHGGRGGRY